jgi:hypothetical protein
MLMNDFLYVCILLIYRLCYLHHVVFERKREGSSEIMIPGPLLALEKPHILVFYILLLVLLI